MLQNSTRFYPNAHLLQQVHCKKKRKKS
uniref:Uncharacterized protein n=1 Tax=Arundo donax TaxID=35708 RepID=A0A0A9B838_ARUDO